MDTRGKSANMCESVIVYDYIGHLLRKKGAPIGAMLFTFVGLRRFPIDYARKKETDW